MVVCTVVVLCSSVLLCLCVVLCTTVLLHPVLVCCLMFFTWERGGGGGGERGWLSGHFGSAAAVCVNVPLTSVCHGAVYGFSPLGKGGGGGG